MATTTKYTYSISTDITAQKLASSRLVAEIGASSIITALDRIDQSGDGLDIWFKDVLSGGDETTLNGLVTAHSGVVLPDDFVQKMLAVTEGGAVQPVAADNKPFVLPNSFPGEVILNFTGCSDKIDAPTERWGGALFGLQRAPNGTDTFTVDMLDGIFLAGGHVSWEGGSWGSYVYFELVAPATTTKAPAVANQGNCDKVATGLGFNIIVPAAGDGEFDLDVPIPVPANDNETYAQNGYWNYTDPWLGKGTITPNATPTAKYNLFDTELELAHMAKIHLAKASGERDLIAPAIKPKWILPQWKMKILAHNAIADTTTLNLTWDLMIARRLSV